VAVALDGVNTAADLVQQAQSDLSAVVIALYAVPAPAAPGTSVLNFLIDTPLNTC
jgi:hypothetical protein